ncbi:MAG: bifunctional UDP-N-acetylglucosamine diphosphorylase/glucosamine-1-phosphate N-acetyltransferase GlmU [Clostridiales bacterium]|nr:bifunctional UDP-N-acetylglucosamine diphosphorylase/glucosamine-1-phosphate N-acetyltransferase GlmU [Clostridiales bacterium]
MIKNCAVILAAGEGKRMKSSHPKVLCEILFKPMIDWVTACAVEGGVADLCVVIGHLSEVVRSHLNPSIETALQSELLGTGHAVMQAKDFLKRHGSGNVLILNADAPLMDSETISNSLNFHVRNENAVTVIAAKVENPFGYGRIVRKDDDTLLKIVEEKEATDEEKEIKEVNSGAYWFNCQALLTALERIIAKKNVAADGSKKEYYLTDIIEVILGLGLKATAFNAESPHLVPGANDRVQLLQLNEIAKKAVLKKHMLAGVSIPCADGVIIGPDVVIGRDTVILPGTILKGKTIIGSDCTIGPNSLVDNTVIGCNVTLNNTQSVDSVIADEAQIGPFVRLRPNSNIGKGVRVGNFVEIKNSNIGDGTKISHLSYIGDSDFGSDINVGCGCATVNYNGSTKSRTVVGNDAFIGCHNSLVAPVSIGERAYTAAGSTITEDVPADSLALARARQVIKKDWVKNKSPYKKK